MKRVLEKNIRLYEKGLLSEKGKDFLIDLLIENNKKIWETIEKGC